MNLVMMTVTLSKKANKRKKSIRNIVTLFLFFGEISKKAIGMHAKYATRSILNKVRM